jgi:hypothetical protein
VIPEVLDELDSMQLNINTFMEIWSGRGDQSPRDRTQNNFETTIVM